MFVLPERIRVSAAPADATEKYALTELIRLLGKLGCKAVPEAGSPGRIVLGPETGTFHPGTMENDGFAISVRPGGIVLAADCSKGLLNAVYALAERFGMRFLHPGDTGELAPEKPEVLPDGESVENPLFPHRGVEISEVVSGYSMEERIRFHAKLRFNAVTFHGDSASPDSICGELGLRKEVGGHGLSSLLDRKLFETHPEYFRMFQPDDFNGKRVGDSNLCVTNASARRIVAGKFAERVRAIGEGTYAVHAWADDLPASGWCLCPSCRSYSAEDQNMLGMRLLCRGAETAGSKIRIPVLAYHDTLFPGRTVPPDPRMFLLWAPRERCYAHAIDDPSCPRNAVHWRALGEWMEFFRNNSDAHTFEYYMDQLLFTGMHPFLPSVIAGDMKAYRRIGIQSHMTLQVACHDTLPDYNELFFARNHWDSSLSEKSFLSWLTRGDAEWSEFLSAQAEAFREPMRMCGYDMKIYLDYRWLPENDTPFARETAELYGKSSAMLSASAKRLEKTASPLLKREAARALFESAEFESMRFQQLAMSEFAKAQIENDPAAARRGCALLKENMESILRAEKLFFAAGYPATTWHAKSRIPWEKREVNLKLANYSDFTRLG